MIINDRKRLSKKDADELKGKLEPDFPTTKPPIELDTVEQNDSAKPTKFNFGNYWQILLAVFRDEALKRLDPTHRNVSLNIRQIGLVVIGILVFVFLIWLLK